MEKAARNCSTHSGAKANRRHGERDQARFREDESRNQGIRERFLRGSAQGCCQDWRKESGAATASPSHSATGLRISGALGLQWQEVDYANHRVNLRRAWVDNKVVERMKTGAVRSARHDESHVAEVLKFGHQQASYSRPKDWIFASPLSTVFPRTASRCIMICHALEACSSRRSGSAGCPSFRDTSAGRVANEACRGSSGAPHASASVPIQACARRSFGSS